MRVVGYVRVSTNNYGQKTSIPAQIELIKNYAESQGWELVEIYIDVESGSKTNREGIQRLMKDATENKFDVVISKELSRISRNGAFSYEFYNVLTYNRIHLVTLDGTINTLDENSMNLGLYAWLSETEAVRTSKRIKASYDVRAGLGLFDEAPYGYDLEKGKLFIAKDGSAEIVKRIYSEFISGKSFDAIGRILFNEDVPTPATRKGKRNASKFWHGSTVRQILEREAYTGCLVAKKLPRFLRQQQNELSIKKKIGLFEKIHMKLLLVKKISI